MDGLPLGGGAVAGLENIRHAAALARRVMEKTPHVLLVGEGARLFAVQQGFPLEELLTPESLAEWAKERPRGSRPDTPRREPPPPGPPPGTHDTVTGPAPDPKGSPGGSCRPSGLAP